MPTRAAALAMLQVAGITHASLHSAAPGEGGANEVAGVTRVAVTWSDVDGERQAGQMRLVLPAGQSATHVGFWSAATGGQFRWALPLPGAARQAPAGRPLDILLPAGSVLLSARAPRQGPLRFEVLPAVIQFSEGVAASRRIRLLGQGSDTTPLVVSGALPAGVTAHQRRSVVRYDGAGPGAAAAAVSFAAGAASASTSVEIAAVDPSWYTALAVGDSRDYPSSVWDTGANSVIWAAVNPAIFAPAVMDYSGSILTTQGIWTESGYLPGTYAVYFGHGHAGAWGNEVSAFGPIGSDNATFHYISRGSAPFEGSDDAALCRNANGYPIGRHTYTHIHFLAHLNRLFLSGCSANSIGNGTSFTSKAVDQFDLGSSAWRSTVGAAPSGWINGPDHTSTNAPTFDAVSFYDGTYIYQYGGSTARRLQVSPTIGAWENVPGFTIGMNDGSTAVDTSRGLALLCDSTGGTQFRVVELANWFSAAGLYTPTISGPLPALASAVGVCFDPVLNRFIYWSGSDANAIYAITPSATPRTQAWTSVRLGSAPTGATSIGQPSIHNRMHYVPSPRGVFLARNRLLPMRFWRL